MDPVLAVSVVAGCIAIVDVMKDFGLPSRYAVSASTMVGVVLYVACMLYPQVGPLLLGLSASGLYAIRKAVSTPDAPA